MLATGRGCGRSGAAAVGRCSANGRGWCWRSAVRKIREGRSVEEGRVAGCGDVGGWRCMGVYEIGMVGVTKGMKRDGKWKQGDWVVVRRA